MSKNKVSAGLAIAVYAAMAALAFGANDGRFEQKDFVISFWVDPPADEHMDDHYRRIAEANFTMVMGGFGTRTPEQMRRQLDLCAKHGLKVLLAAHHRSVDELPDGPACMGYMLRDEPSAADFEALGRRVQDIREKKPGKLGYINLFPSYASPQQLGAASYDEHVRLFVDRTKPDVLCFDYYPMMTPATDGREGYCNNLDTVRQHALKAGVPFWNFFNIMPFGPHFDPTEAQVAWQIYTSLAYGAKGVLYFCYWTPRGGEFPKGGAIITADGRPTRHYDQARRINARIKKLGPTLMKLTSTRVVRIKPGEDSAALLADAPLRKLSDGDYLVGLFDHEDGRKAVLLNNYRFAHTAWPTVEFASDVGDVVELDQQTGRKISFRDDSPDMEGLQISLDAGEGRLFLFGESK